MKRRDFMSKLFAVAVVPAALVACKDRVPKPRMKPVDQFMKMPKGKVTFRLMHSDKYACTVENFNKAFKKIKEADRFTFVKAPKNNPFDCVCCVCGSRKLYRSPGGKTCCFDCGTKYALLYCTDKVDTKRMIS